MNRRYEEKRLRNRELQARFGTEPTAKEAGEGLLYALDVSMNDASCAVTPGTWRPPVTAVAAELVGPPETWAEEGEPMVCEEDPDLAEPPDEKHEPVESPFDADALSARVEASDARQGLDAWTDARIRWTEEIIELEALEELIAAETEEEEEEGEEEPLPSETKSHTEEPARLRDVLVASEYMREWEECEPLTAGVTSLPLRQLAELVHVGVLSVDLANGKPIHDAFDARHARAGALIRQIDRSLAEDQTPPETLVASALESRVRQALDRVLTAEMLRLPQEIRRVIVEFRQDRDSRAAPLKAFLSANDDLERAHVVLDQREAAVRSGEANPATRDIRLYGDIIETCDVGFKEIARLEQALADVEERLERHRGTFLTLCDRARTTINLVAQIRAAAQMLQIPFSDTMSAQAEKETRRLFDAVETYTAEMDAEFEVPQRNASVRRLENELPERRKFYAALTRPRAENFFRSRIESRDEEIRRLILLTYDATCNSGRVKVRSIRAVTGSIMVRAGFIREEESDRARELFASKEATAWRQANFDHNTVGLRGHIYIPNEAGKTLAKSYFRELLDNRGFMERVLRALQEHRAAAAEEEITKKAAKA